MSSGSSGKELRTDTEALIIERDCVSATPRAIKTGAAEISQLLAADVLGGEEWEGPCGSALSVGQSESG